MQPHDTRHAPQLSNEKKKKTWLNLVDREPIVVFKLIIIFLEIELSSLRGHMKRKRRTLRRWQRLRNSSS